MKKFNLLFIACLLAVVSNVTLGQDTKTKQNLSPVEFSTKIKQQPAAILIDVRSPEEFASGHLANAKNMDWNGTDFQNKIAKVDKSKAVFVYCQSGGRSAAAAAEMRAKGFKEVYEMEGGIGQWKSAKLPVTK